jgi:hypothetical protein
MEKETLEKKRKNRTKNIQVESETHGTSEIEEIDEPKTPKEHSGSESEIEEHHDKDEHQQKHGLIRSALQKSGELLGKAATYISDLAKGSNAGTRVQEGAKLVGEGAGTLGKIGGDAIQKLELSERAKSIGENIATAGKSIIKGATGKAVDVVTQMAVGADLWKESKISHDWKVKNSEDGEPPKLASRPKLTKSRSLPSSLDSLAKE